MSMEFTSVRAINKAVQDAAMGKLQGKYVYVKTREDGQFKKIRIKRATADKHGGLKVQILTFGEPRWIECEWSEVITQ